MTGSDAEGVWPGKPAFVLDNGGFNIQTLAFAPGSRRLASANGLNEEIIFWEIPVGGNPRKLRGFVQRSTTSLAFSPDGRLLAGASEDKTVKIWEVATGRTVQTLSGHSSDVVSVAFSRDGRRLASGSFDHTIKLWNVADGSLLRTLTGHRAEIRSVAFTPDSTFVISGSNDNTVKLWDVATGKNLQTFTSHKDWIWGVDFSSFWRLFASGSYDQTIILWDITTGKPLRTLAVPLPPEALTNRFMTASLAFDPDPRRLASGSDNTIRLWDVATGKELGRYVVQKQSAISPAPVAFSSDGSLLAAGIYNQIAIWKMPALPPPADPKNR